jgi:hypothetical protein
MTGSPTDLPFDLYCRYGVCQPGEPHMPWCSEYPKPVFALAQALLARQGTVQAAGDKQDGSPSGNLAQWEDAC